MKITEVKVKPMRDKRDKLLAFASITIDDAFVIRELKIIKGAKGVFVAMPSRKVTDKCPECGCKNHIRARFCNDCGRRIDDGKKETSMKEKFHVDVAHPINSECREQIQKRVMEAYRNETERDSEEASDENPAHDDTDDMPERPEQDVDAIEDDDVEEDTGRQNDNSDEDEPEKKSRFGFGIFS